MITVIKVYKDESSYTFSPHICTLPVLLDPVYEFKSRALSLDRCFTHTSSAKLLIMMIKLWESARFSGIILDCTAQTSEILINGANVELGGLIAFASKYTALCKTTHFFWRVIVYFEFYLKNDRKILPFFVQ